METIRVIIQMIIKKHFQVTLLIMLYKMAKSYLERTDKA